MLLRAGSQSSRQDDLNFMLPEIALFPCKGSLPWAIRSPEARSNSTFQVDLLLRRHIAGKGLNTWNITIADDPIQPDDYLVPDIG